MTLKTYTDEIVLFSLQREYDESGVSGTGVIAYGVKCPYPNGKVSLAWVAGSHHSVAVYDSISDVEAIHGHGGSTHIIPLYRADMGSP